MDMNKKKAWGRIQTLICIVNQSGPLAAVHLPAVMVRVLRISKAMLFKRMALLSSVKMSWEQVERIAPPRNKQQWKQWQKEDLADKAHRWPDWRTG